MKKISKLNRILGAAAILGATVFLPMSSNANAEEAKDKTPKWEITAGYVNRSAGKVKFSGRSDFQKNELDSIIGGLSESPYYNPIVQHINENWLESGQLPTGPFSVTPDFDIKTKSITIGGVEDKHKSNCMNLWIRKYDIVENFGPGMYSSPEGVILDKAHGSEPDGITDKFWIYEPNDGSVTFSAEEATKWAEAHNSSAGRSTGLGNASGFTVGVRRNFNNLLSLALEYAGPFSFEGEANSNPFRAALKGTLTEIRDTYQLSDSTINMNEFQRERITQYDSVDFIALNNYVNERAKVDLNTLSLVGRVGKNLKKLRLEGLLGAELNFAKMTVDRNERLALSSDVESVQEGINNSCIGYERSTSESKSKVIPGAVVGAGLSYNVKSTKNLDVYLGVEGQYHFAFDKMKVGNAEANINGHAVIAKVDVKFDSFKDLNPLRLFSKH